MNRLNICIPLLSIFFTFLLFSCYPEGAEYADELDVVETQFDKEFDFGSIEYYLMSDSVTVLSRDDYFQKTAAEIAMEDKMLDAIQTQMSNAGYTRLAPADTSDDVKMQKALVLNVSRATTNYSGVYYDNSYYNNRYYYGYPGYGYNYYYPWGYPVTYSYAVGTVILELIDPNDPIVINETTDEISYPLRWIATLNRLAQTGKESTETRIIKGINQAFDQSPYLR